MTCVAINQSNYIPWKGYFDLIHDVDLFIFYDDVQYTIRDWRNRNVIKTPNGLLWLTVPVGVNRNRLINEVSIGDHRWQQTHWKTIEQNYRKANYFKRYKDFFEEIYLHLKWDSLSNLNQFLIEHIAKDYLQIKTIFTHSTEFSRVGEKQEAILSLLESAGASIYYSGPAAKAYIEPEAFQKTGVGLIWKDYSGYPEYPQFYPPFRHDVSILDLLFHTGPDAPYYIWGWREENRIDGGQP